MNNAVPDQRHEDLCLMCLVVSHLYWSPVDITNSILKSAVGLPVIFPKLDRSTKQTHQNLVAVTAASSSMFMTFYMAFYELKDHFRFLPCAAESVMFIVECMNICIPLGFYAKEKKPSYNFILIYQCFPTENTMVTI